MSMARREQIARLVKNGATVMGVYYDGIGVLAQLKRDFCCDSVYRQLDQKAFELASFVQAHAQRAQLIDELRAELGAMRADAVAGKLESKHRVVWIVNVWCLLKLGVLQNDDRNGLQFAGNQFGAS